MTYQPPQHPHWQPAQPQPAAAPRRTPWKLIGLITGGVLVLCCGGFTAIGALTDDKATPEKPAAVAGNLPAVEPPTDPAAGEPTGAAVPADEATTPTASKSATRTRSPGPTRTRATTAPATRPATARPTTSRPAPKPTTKKPTPRPTTKAPSAVYYDNCTAVREAGADPIRRGDPGYGSHLDRDGDGVGCE